MPQPVAIEEPPTKRRKKDRIMEKLYQLQNKGDSMLMYAYKMKESGKFNDISVKTGNASFSAHKVILSSCSKVLEDMCLAADERNEKCIVVNGIDEASLKAILDFFYTGKIVVSRINARSLLKAAFDLKLCDVKRFCFDFLSLTLEASNSFETYDLAFDYEIDYLKSQALRFIASDFVNVVESRAYGDWTKEKLVLFISSLDKTQINQSQVYKLISAWTDKDKEERFAEFPDLCLLVDLNDLHPPLLEDYIKRQNIRERKRSDESDENRPDRQITRKEEGRLICLGGLYTRQHVDVVYHCFDNQSSIQAFPDLKKPRFWGCAVAIDRVVYFIGGCDKDCNSQRSVWKIDTSVNEMKWQNVQDLNEPRRQAGSTIFQNKPVVVGGRKNAEGGRSQILANGEYFSRRKWKAIDTMRHPRAEHGLVVCKKVMYAIGGYDDKDETLASVECLDALEHKWKEMKPMNTKRLRLAAVECEGYIYAIGGRQDWKKPVLNSAERYDVEKNEWSDISSMRFKRTGFDACVLKGRIFVVGGYDGEKVVKEIECYDTLTNTWSIVGTTEDKLLHHSILTI